MRRQVAHALGVLVLVVAASVARAQSPGGPLQVTTTNPFAGGPWYGAIKDYPFSDSPLRMLNVAAVGGRLVCTWDQPGKATAQLNCSIQGNVLTLMTGPGTNVTLYLEGKQLKGTFAPKAGGSYDLTMARQPVASPPAATASRNARAAETLCKQEVDYTIRAPAPELSADAKAFLGVWKGEWNNLLCAALIVEDIKPDGSATIVYVNGVGIGASAVKFRSRARLIGKTLSWASPRVEFDFSLESAKHLSAKRSSNFGMDEGSFTRE